MDKLTVYRVGNTQAFKAWQGRMQRPRDKVLTDKFAIDLLKSRGLSQEIPFLPRSLYDPTKLYEALDLFSKTTGEGILLDKNIQYGLSVAKRIFRNPLLHQGSYLPLTARPEHHLDVSKSAGLPTLKKKKDVDIEALRHRIELIRQGAVPAPCLAQARTQKNNKTRLVWGYPYEMTYLEQIYANSLISYFNKKITPITTGSSKLDLGVRIAACDYQDNVTALDYSRYDTSIPRSLIHEAFKIIKTYFPESAHTDFQIIERYFIFTPIVMPDGKLHQVKVQGVPSGSSFTQLVDSIVNVILSFALSRRFKLGLKPKHLFVLGDDVLMFTKVSVTDKLLSGMKKWLSQFGFHINENKTQIGVNHFLGATWEFSLRHRPQSEILANLAYPENVRRYKFGNELSGANLTLTATLTDSMSSANLVVDKTGWQKRPIPDHSFSWGVVDPSQLEGYMKFLRHGKLKKESLMNLQTTGWNKSASVVRAYES